MNRHIINILTFFIISLLFFLPDIADAATDGTDFISDIYKDFQEQTRDMMPIFNNAVKYWFGIVAALEICLIGVRAVLGKSGDLGEAMKELAMTIFIITFFWFVFENYQEWTQQVINVLQKLAFSATKIPQVDTDKPFLTGLMIVNKLLTMMRKLPITVGSIPTALGFFLTAGVVLFIFALISARVLLIKCESVIAISAAIVLLPLGACGILRSYAQNVMKYVLAVAFKLFVMQLTIGIGIGFINKFSRIGTVYSGLGAGAGAMGGVVGDVSEAVILIQFQELFPIIGACIVLYALVNTLPETAAGIINGGTVGGGSGAGIGAAASAIGGAVGAAVGTAISGPMKAISQAMSGIGAVNAASKLANDAGKTGFGKLGHMAGSLYQASKDFDRQHNPEKAEAMNRSLQEQYKMAQKPPASQNKGENS